MLVTICQLPTTHYYLLRTSMCNRASSGCELPLTTYHFLLTTYYLPLSNYY